LLRRARFSDEEIVNGEHCQRRRTAQGRRKRPTAVNIDAARGRAPRFGTTSVGNET